MYKLSWVFAWFISISMFATNPHGSNHPNSSISFTPVRIMEATPVKSQGRSSTCWSFSGMSFFESEMMRKGKPEVELSEMFVVRMVYLAKAVKYVRMHGTVAFPAGGAFSDPLYVLREYGLLPRSAYEGNTYAPDAPINHGELDEILQAYVQAVVKNKNKSLTEVWLKGFERVLDTYLGPLPSSFSYNKKQLSRPEDFRRESGLDASDYISLTSFSHHPFYGQFAIEVPDNWSWDLSYNLPLNEFMETVWNALSNGYSLAWASDVSDPGFQHKFGLAVVPKNDISSLKGQELEDFFMKPVEEREINQTMRQKDFDTYVTTDDHGMHAMGLVKDQTGKRYIVVKNSWGAESNSCGGYLYVSENFFALRTLSILLHKDAIPSTIRKKLAI